MPRAAAWALSTFVLIAGAVHAGERRVIGPTFPIAEPDLLQEIKQRAATMDWNALVHRKDPASYTAFQTVSLPHAAVDASYLFDPTYTLPQDVKDQNGVVLYPAGTTINVYARRQFPGRTIVIAAEPAHWRWLDEVARPAPTDKVLISGTNMIEAKALAGARPIHALDARIVERFGLRAVPSIVQQEGTQLRVREFRLTSQEAH